jgi:hypothetical protein
MARTPVPSSHRLPGGPLVRVRFPVASDRAKLRDLLDRAGGQGGDLAERRLLRFDPRTRVALVAAVALNGSEVLVGYMAGDLRQGAGPDLIVADERLAPGVADVLADMLRTRVEDQLARSA